VEDTPHRRITVHGVSKGRREGGGERRREWTNDGRGCGGGFLS
jgi:hypothetical protein